MNLYNLKYFLDSARMGSMTKAAEFNHLSRPAISHAIRNLEQELSLKLLVHKRRSFELTQAGITLLKKSDAIFVEIENLKSALKSSNEHVMGDFRIGSARTLASFTLQNTLKKMRKKHPHVDFKISLEQSEVLIKKLAQREIDIAFFIGDENLNGFKQKVIARGNYCLMRPKTLSATNTSYALTEKRSETERVKILFEREYSLPLPIFAEIPSWDVIWTWMNQGVSGGLVPDFLLKAKPQDAKNLSIVFPKVFPYEIKVMFPQSKANNPLIKTFLESIEVS
jgi:DNA-binding transcriptional LysR family regulator